MFSLLITWLSAHTGNTLDVLRLVLHHAHVTLPRSLRLLKLVPETQEGGSSGQSLSLREGMQGQCGFNSSPRLGCLTGHTFDSIRLVLNQTSVTVPASCRLCEQGPKSCSGSSGGTLQPGQQGYTVGFC